MCHVISQAIQHGLSVRNLRSSKGLVFEASFHIVATEASLLDLLFNGLQAQVCSKMHIDGSHASDVSTNPLRFSRLAEIEVEFHNQYQRILTPLTLSSIHNQDLLERGLNEAQRAQGFYSWPGGLMKVPTVCGQTISQFTNNCLHYQNIHVKPGLLIPACSPQGHITGLQIKPDSEGAAKYIMVSSGSSIKLLHDELPLAVCMPDWCSFKTHEVVLIEGFLKPHVVAMQLGRVPIIGASGGAFYKSPRLLGYYLSMPMANAVLFIPDAGAVRNFDVVLCYLRSFQLLEQLGIQTSIAWWGQVDKYSDDADVSLGSEFKQLPTITRLSVSELWALCNKDVQSRIISTRHAKSMPNAIRPVLHVLHA